MFKFYRGPPETALARFAPLREIPPSTMTIGELPMRLTRTLILHAVACAACLATNIACGSHDHPAAVATAPDPRPPASRPSTATVQTWQSIEVRYGGRLQPRELSPERKQKIVELAADAAPAGRRIWFILVLYNKDDTYNTLVYSEPDVSTSRMRKGTYVGISDWTERARKRKPAAPPNPEAEDGRAPPRYVQVSDADAPFTHLLTVPRAELMPFDPDSAGFGEPAKISDEEWVALVDLVRPAFERAGGGPVHRAEVRDGVLRVYSGWQEGMLAGSGSFVDVKRKPSGGFKLVGDSVGIWAS